MLRSYPCLGFTLAALLAFPFFAGPATGSAAKSPESRHVLRDGVGREVRVPSSPHRIISLAPSITETLFAVGAGSRVVGVTDFCDYPPAVRSLPRIGGLLNPNWEAILRLRPDLLIATTAGNDRTLVGEAEELHLSIYFVDTPDLPTLMRSISSLGQLLGVAAEATRVERDLAGRLRRLEEEAPTGARPRILYLVWGDPIVVPGRGTFLADALRRAGCDSITSDAPPGWPTYDLETILQRQPDWILAARQNERFLDALKQKPGWRKLKAVQNGNIATLSEAIERPSPRVVAAMEELQRLIKRRE